MPSRPFRSLRFPHPCRIALAAALSLLSTAPGAQNVFTGNRPVYVGSWFNGNFTEVQEFQFALDWAGWCNARAGATCQSIAFWSQAQNWGDGVVPIASSTVQVPIGRTVRLGAFNSVFQGPLSGEGRVGDLSVGGRFENSGYLRSGHAAITDYFAFVGGVIETPGLTSIQLLSSPQASFAGVGGRTQITNWSNPFLTLAVATSHTLQLVGGPVANAQALSSGSISVSMAPSSVVENLGNLTPGDGSRFFLQGTANSVTLPTFNNLGGLSGSTLMDGLRFNNHGSVSLAGGEVLGMGLLGNHTGSFVAAASSQMRFGGFVGPGMVFEAGSSMNSEGRVTALRGSHRVLGSWRSADLDVVGNSAAMRFEGSAPSIDRLLVQGEFGANVTLASTGLAQLGGVTIDNGSLTVETGRAATHSLQLLRGAVDVQTELVNSGAFDWTAGRLGGRGTVTQQGATRLLASATPRLMLQALVLQQGDLTWEGGSFSHWSGEWRVASGKRFDIQGDFSAAGGTGALLSLQGAELLKSAGSGRAELGMNVLNRGTVQVNSGVLALSGGSTHLAGSRLTAAAGALIELGGTTMLHAGLQQSGRIDVVGGTLSLMPGLNFVSSTPSSRFDPTNLVLAPGARLERSGAVNLAGSLDNAGEVVIGTTFEVGVNARNEGLLNVGGALTVRGQLANTGALSVGGDILVLGDFTQAGTLSRPSGSNIYVVGQFDSRSSLQMDNANLQVGRLVVNAPLFISGVYSGFANHIDNRSTLSLAGVGSQFSVWESVDNHGTIRVDGSAQGFSSGTLLTNRGVIVSEGTVYSNDLLLLAGSRFDNLGILNHSGIGVLAAGSQLRGSGHVENQGGQLQIDAGAVLATGQLYRQWGGGPVQVPLTRVNGLLDAPLGIEINAGELRGAGTIRGDVWVAPGALWAPGNSPGTLTVDGAAALGGTLEIEVQSRSVHDRLVVSGGLNAFAGSVLHFVLDPAFAPEDGDRIDWLQAPGAGLSEASVQVTGGTGFGAQLGPDGMGLLLTDPNASALPASGSVTILAGTVRFNDRPHAFDPLRLDAVSVEGTLSNRPGAQLWLDGALHVSPGGVVLQRGGLDAYRAGTLNEGRWRGDAGSTSNLLSLDNRGQYETHGSDIADQVTNRSGATMEVVGRFESYNGWVNEGRLDISGEALERGAQLLNRGALTVHAGGRLTVNVLMQSPGTDRPLLRVDGRLEASQGVQVLDGELQGTGVVAADLLMGGNTRLAPGNSIGQLAVSGNLNSNGSELFLEIGDDGAHDQLAVGGTLDWTYFMVTLVFDDLELQPLGTLQLVNAGRFAGSLCGGCWQIATGTAETGYSYWGQASPFTDITVRFDANGQLTVAAIPEPQTWAMFIAGLLAVGAFKRRAGRR